MKVINSLVITILGALLLFATSCKEEKVGVPTLSTMVVTDITETTASSGGDITSDGGAPITARGVCWSSTNQLPTISDNKTSDGTGVGKFSSTLSDLLPNTTYYVRAYATNSKGTGYGGTISFTTLRVFDFGSFTDLRDGTVYKTIKIGDQVWMAENLRYLPNVVGPETGSNIEPYCYVYDYNGTDVTAAKATENYDTYGVLYNWSAAMNGATSSNANPSGVRGICPAGWHLPSDAEWTQLIDYLGGEDVAGGKLKETGTQHWIDPNTGATNETGFTALPGGSRHHDGHFDSIGGTGIWWSATEGYATYAWGRYVYYNSSTVRRRSNYKELGFSVRCLRD